MAMEFIDLKQILHLEYPELEIVPIDPHAMVFEERVKQKCFHCKNYNYKWTCPPKTPTVDYSKLFCEYEHAAVVICKVSIDSEHFEEKRSLSTNIIHKSLLYLESELYKENNTMALSFIGGSCKLCKNGCNKEHCVNPYLSRMPWEATGCNVIESLKSIGVNVTFPITDTLYRYGLFLW